jgi:hypothetical protein
VGPLSIYDLSFLQTIEQWFKASGELFAELYYPHSGGSGDYYLFSSLHDFRTMLAEARPNAVFIVLRGPQYPIRGTVDDALVRRALQEVPEGEWYDIVDFQFYPARLSHYGNGDSQEKYQKDLEECRGIVVCTGREPKLPDSYWIRNDAQDVIIGRKPGRPGRMTALLGKVRKSK